MRGSLVVGCLAVVPVPVPAEQGDDDPRDHDDVAEMFCKRLLKIQHQRQEAFKLAQKATRERLTRLVEALRNVTQAYEKEGTISERMEAIDAVYGGNSAKILADCEAHYVRNRLCILQGENVPTHIPLKDPDPGYLDANDQR